MTERETLTVVVDEEPLAQDETGINGITLELDGDLRPPGDNLEALPGGHVLSDHVGRQVLAVEDSQHVGVADVKTVRDEIEARFKKKKKKLP